MHRRAEACNNIIINNLKKWMLSEISVMSIVLN